MTTNGERSSVYSNTPHCLVCGESLVIRPALGRRSRKQFIMLQCPQDGRHFRAFISHEPYVRQVMRQMEAGKGDREGTS